MVGIGDKVFLAVSIDLQQDSFKLFAKSIGMKDEWKLSVGKGKNWEQNLMPS